MTRVDDLRARYEAELAVAELEERLVAAKATGELPYELKEQLRQARRAFRQMREGDAAVAPATVEASTGWGRADT